MQDWNQVYIAGYWVRGNYSIQYNTALRALYRKAQLQHVKP